MITHGELERSQLSKWEVLERAPLLAKLPPHLLTVMMRRCDVVSATVGTVILTEHRPADNFYVLARGAVTLTHGSHADATLSTSGDVIGLAAVLTRQPAQATALVVEEA